MLYVNVRRKAICTLAFWLAGGASVMYIRFEVISLLTLIQRIYLFGGKP